MSKAIIFTGATGKQGGAALRALQESPKAAEFTFLAVTRNAESASAKKLEAKGVKIVQGDLNDVPAIFESAKKVAPNGIWGVFSVQIPIGSGASTDSEERQGKALVDGALANDVKFFVQTSVDRGGDDDASYNDPTFVPHFISKHNIEHHLVDNAKGKMQWTILRPTAFMDNFDGTFMAKAMGSMFRIGLRGKKVQLIAVKDIGVFAAKAFENPDQYAGRGISLAGDELDFNEIAATWKKVRGEEFPSTFGVIARGLMYMLGDVNQMLKWFVEVGYKVNIPKLRAEYPGLLSFEDFLKAEKK